MSKYIYPCSRRSVGHQQVSLVDGSDIHENDLCSNLGNSEVQVMNENIVHRLVLPENAKTILLNVPLECSNSAGKNQQVRRCRLANISGWSAPPPQ